MDRNTSIKMQSRILVSLKVNRSLRSFRGLSSRGPLAGATEIFNPFFLLLSPSLPPSFLRFIH